MPGVRRFRSLQHLTLNSALLRERYSHQHLCEDEGNNNNNNNLDSTRRENKLGKEKILYVSSKGVVKKDDHNQNRPSFSSNLLNEEEEEEEDEGDKLENVVEGKSLNGVAAEEFVYYSGRRYERQMSCDNPYDKIWEEKDGSKHFNEIKSEECRDSGFQIYTGLGGWKNSETGYCYTGNDKWHSMNENGDDDSFDEGVDYEYSESVTLLRRKGRLQSLGVTATENAAEAFGDDIADDSYSVSELSNYNEEKRSSKKHGRSNSGKGKAGDNFSKAKLTRLQREGSVSAPDSTLDVNGNGAEAPRKSDGSTPPRQASTGSNNSDDVWGDGAGGSGDHRHGKRDSGDSESDESETFTTASFASFAMTRFQARMPYVYACAALPHPLLPQHDRADYLAALAAWVTIQRIMGDLPDLDSGNSIIVAGTEVPLTTRIKIGFKAKYTKKDLDEAHSKYSDLFKDPSAADTRTIPFMPTRADTMLDKIQFVCALGIFRPNLRDELYCQLCKQLTNNPSRNSVVRGWVLMDLFAGSFTPSERFAPSLTSFLRDGPPEFSEKVDRLLRRTCSSGTRGHPVSWLEFQSSKNGKPLLIPVTFMNGHRLLCEVDSATTVCEMMQNLKERLDITDISGFSIYISLQTKISCLGHGQHRVMDAISECEQHTKELGLKESSALWRLFFRREFFTPWCMPGQDPVTTDLDYQQIKRGINVGEYRLQTVEVLVKTAAKMFYIEYPADQEFENLVPFLSAMLPDDQYDKSKIVGLADQVKAEIAAQNFFKEKPQQKALKSDLVAYVLDTYYILYSRYYDVSKVVLHDLTLHDATLGVNNKGVFIMDGPERVRHHTHLSEILDVTKTKHCVTFTLVGAPDLVFQTMHADDFSLLVTSFLEQLKKRATIAIAKQDVTHLDGPPDSNIVKGDIVRLATPIPDEDLTEGDAIVAVQSVRSGKRCDVPTKTLYLVAPEAARTPDTLLERLSQHIRKNPGAGAATEGKQQHTLQQYAKANFRPSSESTMTKLFNRASIKKKEPEHLWSFTKDVLKKPLLKKTMSRDDIRKLACHCFTSIQTYMTNLVINDEVTNFHLCSDWILNPARRNKYLRDEIYCQVVKQLTHNPDNASAHRGWILFALLTALTTPTKELVDQCLAFCRSSPHPLARECQRNLVRKRKHGGDRLYSCHILEYEIISRQQPSLKVQVYLPNQTVQTLDVTSHTRIFDMKKEVAQRLHLKSCNEYSIFLTSNERVHCLSDKTFYFDCLSHSEVYWFKNGRRGSQPASRQSPGPMVVMLKKIWVNDKPGQDKIADQVFHYCQEMPNYLRGYHLTPDVNVPKLASLVYRAQHGSDESFISTFKDVASRILPVGYMEGRQEAEVQKAIQCELASNVDMTSAQARSAFLSELCQLQTYGSVFFEVKQRYVKSLPKNCLIAINYRGVHFIDQKNKEILKTYEFYTIPNWAYDDTSFTFIVTHGGQSTWKLLVETNVGHNMDDLMMSYVAWIMNYQMRKRYGYIGSEAGESIC